MFLDFDKNLIIVDAKEYNMDQSRAFILQNCATLCHNRFIAIIKSKGRLIWTYDWAHIFSIAIISGVLNDDIVKTLKTKRIKMSTANTKKVSLSDIEKIIKPNFIWEKKDSKHRLQTSWKFEGNKSIALVVFVGLTHFLGFQKFDVIDYLDINKRHYDKLLEWFMACYENKDNPNISLDISNGVDEEKKEIFKVRNKIITKYNIVASSIKMYHPTTEFISLNDFNF